MYLYIFVWCNNQVLALVMHPGVSTPHCFSPHQNSKMCLIMVPFKNIKISYPLGICRFWDMDQFFVVFSYAFFNVFVVQEQEA